MKETKEICDILSFVAMVYGDNNAHINLPKNIDLVNRHYEICRDLFGQDVANHFKDLLNKQMQNCREG